MTETDLCLRCGGPLTKSQALHGRCPRCMLVLGLESTYLDGEEGEAEEEPSGKAGDSGIPTSIGRYRILRVIGAGGMGIVYEAEQDQPRRVVALKIIKPGLVSDELLRRFEQESQALGRLHHPGIAQIYEAGTVDTGFGPQPYFAMELISGQSPRDYAESHHLNTNQRLEIMVKICDAVQHAHQRGLIHRDLKPANILVDENAQPKILDFGVARATDSDTRSTLQTDFGQLIGTLAYMSPEQALADPMDIDTRSDVYSLGVILYELLAGRLPYDISRKLDKAIHTIREEDPLRLSASNRTYRGDIETIVGKALEKERVRRYASASEMATDLRRFLKDEPISARPPSASYQLRKFTRRHKGLVGGIATMFVILVAGIIISTSLLIRAKRAEAEAKSAAIRADEAGSLATAMQQVALGLFGRPPGLSQFEGLPNPNTSVNDALDTVVKEIRFRSQGHPQQEAAIRELVAEMFSAQGRYEESRDQLEIAMKLRALQAATDPHTLRDTLRLAQIYLNLRLFSKAEELLNKVTFDSRKATSGTDALMQSTIRSFASLYRLNRSTDASQAFSKLEHALKDDIIDYYRRHSGEGNVSVQEAENTLFDLYINYSPPKYAEAEVFWEQVAAERRRLLGEGDRSALTAEKQLISLLIYLEPRPNYAGAEASLKPLVEAQRHSLGDDNPATQATINYLVRVYLDRLQPNYTDAEDFLKRIREEARRKLGTHSSADRNASIALSSVYFKEARYLEADQLLIPYSTDAIVEDAIVHPLALVEQLAIPNYVHTLQLNSNFGYPIPTARAMARLTMQERSSIVDVLDRRTQIYIKLGDPVQARKTSAQVAKLLETSVNTYRTAGGWYLGRPLMSMGSIALGYIEQERFKEAEALLKTVVEGYGQLAGNSSNAPDIAIVLTLAALGYSEKGHHHEAETLLNKILNIDQAGASRSYTVSTSLVRLGAWYMDRGRYEEAEAVLNRLANLQISPVGPFGSAIRTAIAAAADVYDSGARNAFVLGQRERARQLLGKSLEARRQLLDIYQSQSSGERFVNTGRTLTRIGIDLAMLGRYPEAERTFTQVIAIQKSTDGVAPELKSAAIANLGWTQFHQQKYAAAEATLRESLQSYLKIQSDTWERYNTESLLGAALVASKKYGEAEPYLLSSDEKLHEREPLSGVESAFTSEIQAGERILTLYQEWGKPGKVAEWRQKLLANKPAATTTPALR